MRYLVEVRNVFQPIAPVRGCYVPETWPLALCGSQRKAARIADGFNLDHDDCKASVRPVVTPRRASWAHA